MRAKLPLISLVLTLLSASTLFAQGTIVLYDPMAKLPEANPSPAEEAFVKEKLVPKVRARWSENDYCDGSSLNIVGAVDGSFTKAG